MNNEKVSTLENSQASASVEREASKFVLEADPGYADFERVEVTAVDETKPWKPALEVAVTKADGSRAEGVAASTPFFHLKSGAMDVTLSAAAAGHIDALHIKGTEPGSHFDYPSLGALMKDVSEKLQPEMLEGPGPSALAIDMKRPMGKEGIASFDELKGRGMIDDSDLQSVVSVKNEVSRLNEAGTPDEKSAFISAFKNEHPESKIQFQLVRGVVLVPVVDAPKQDTTQLFMVAGPDAARPGQKTFWTMAPGRFMPRHPDPSQHMEKQEDGSMKLNQATFKESSEAWFDTVMLTGK